MKRRNDEGGKEAKKEEKVGKKDKRKEGRVPL